jgi:hypothetical protein
MNGGDIDGVEDVNPSKKTRINNMDNFLDDQADEDDEDDEASISLSELFSVIILVSLFFVKGYVEFLHLFSS